jgi:hypothetical protein
MHAQTSNDTGFPDGCNPKQLFRLRFQRSLTDFLVRNGSVAEGFGIVWEKTLEGVPLDDKAQGEAYRDLLSWAKSDELFTNQLLAAWKETVHEY